jgi:hypothetical protein
MVDSYSVKPKLESESDWLILVSISSKKIKSALELFAIKPFSLPRNSKATINRYD